MSGSLCYRTTTEALQDNNFECPSKCQFIKYEANIQMEKPITEFMPELDNFGLEFKKALLNDPSIMFVQNKFTNFKYGTVKQKMYLEEAIKSYTLVQVRSGQIPIEFIFRTQISYLCYQKSIYFIF